MPNKFISISVYNISRSSNHSPFCIYSVVLYSTRWKMTLKAKRSCSKNASVRLVQVYQVNNSMNAKLFTKGTIQIWITRIIAIDRRIKFNLEVIRFNLFPSSIWACSFLFENWYSYLNAKSDLLLMKTLIINEIHEYNMCTGRMKLITYYKLYKNQSTKYGRRHWLLCKLDGTYVFSFYFGLVFNGNEPFKLDLFSQKQKLIWLDEAWWILHT